MNKKLHTCCFFGHRKIDATEKTMSKLKESVERLIVDNKVDTFLFGSKSQFDDLCYKIVTELKEKYPHIRRIYVRAKFQHIDDSYKNYLLESFEDTYYPEKISDSGKAAYVERNYEMIDKSKFCIVYYNENYAPPKRKQSKKHMTYYQPKSGTKIAFEYAAKKGKDVFNIFDYLY